MIKKIMVVDDSATARKHISLMLERDGFTNLVMANDASDALGIIESDEPDLFILDVLMPGMDGIELCKQIRSLPEFSQTPVIIVSALGDPQSVGNGFDAGADDYLSKPIVQYDLVMKVRRMLDKNAAEYTVVN